ncbi:unnamed protein product [Sphagnum jensenii]|uniref:Uncharacterized protein n=1 Tax=Sphagnum jensenii TaxID=128206 RepID=A0ABP0VIA0_9BRYO
MASISPGVRFHIESETWKQHIDEDEVTIEALVNECATIIIDELYELGVEFFCTRNDLCDGYYHIDKLLLFCEVIFPTPLYRTITEDEAFRRYLVSTVVEGAGDPEISTAMDILAHLTFQHQQAEDIFLDTYLFLNDTMKSTPVFDRYIISVLNTDNTPFTADIDKNEIDSYLDRFKAATSRLRNAIDEIRLSFDQAKDVVDIQYDRLEQYISNKTDPEALLKYIWVDTMHAVEQQSSGQLTPIEQTLMLRYEMEFQSITPFYETYYRLQDSRPNKADALSLVLGAYDTTTTREDFTHQVDTIFQRMAGFQYILDTDIHMFVMSVTMFLVQEFYP